jgi:hypothetical protein
VKSSPPVRFRGRLLKDDGMVDACLGGWTEMLLARVTQNELYENRGVTNNGREGSE